MVLDGQQRLQSLYVALKGSYNGQQLYFDVLGSGVNDQNTAQARYRFAFLTEETTAARNKKQAGKQYWILLADVYDCKSLSDQIKLVDHLLKSVELDQFSPTGMRLRENVNTAFSKLKLEDVLSFYTIDPTYGEEDEPRPVEDILEIFVRINSGVQVLTRSDLMFSLLKLKWEGAGETIDSLAEAINQRRNGSFKFSNDFILRCALVCIDKGARYDINKLRNTVTIQELEAEFPRVARALLAAVDFLVGDARILNHSILGSSNTLIPFVYFFYHQDKQRLQGEGARRDMKVAHYLALMTRVFAAFSDSRIDGVIREVIRPAVKLKPGAFPLAEFRAFVNRRVGRGRFDNWLLQRNQHLLMNILNHGTVLPQKGHRPEYDHIFPQSKLRAHDYRKEQINEFANIRLISKPENIWKSNIDPQTYFADHPGVAGEYLIPVDLLSYEDYPDFLTVRRERIWEQVIAFLGLRADEYVNDNRLPPGYENKAVDALEKRLRDFIDEQLLEHVGEKYWKRSIPHETRKMVEARIADDIKKHPGTSIHDFPPGRRRLDFCDMSDYQIIILDGGNWPIFDNTFISRYEFERHMSAVVRFRNGIKHGCDVHQVERLTGEAGIIWLNEALGVKKPAQQTALEENEQQVGEEQGGPSPEDYDHLLIRRNIPFGQKHLFKALYVAGDTGLSRDELVEEVGRGRSGRLGGVFGALGKRVNGTPGYFKTHMPGIGAVRYWHRKGEHAGRMAMQPEMRDALERLDPDWLHGDWPK